MNKVILVGNLCAVPELRYTSTGTAVMNARLATNERISDGVGGWKNEATFHSVIIWSRRAEGLAKVLDKGSHVLVEGKLKCRIWEDKNNNKHYITEIHATNVELLGGTKKNNSTEDSSPSDEEVPYTDENVPF